ncbi:hypothetical protein PTKIN_Ptkin16aG0483400 [Pterospermum kingtungense]
MKDNHTQHHQQQPSTPQAQVPLKQNPPKNDSHPPTSSNKKSHQSQPTQPPNGVSLETHRSNSKHSLKSNPPQKQQPPIGVSAPPPPSNDTVLEPGFPMQWPKIQPVLAYPAPNNVPPGPSKEPVVAFPDPSKLSPTVTLRPDTKQWCCCEPMVKIIEDIIKDFYTCYRCCRCCCWN